MFIGVHKSVNRVKNMPLLVGRHNFFCLKHSNIYLPKSDRSKISVVYDIKRYKC